MRVGILTIFSGNYNYGGMLQAYALNKVINSMGYDAYTVNFEYGTNPLYPTMVSRCKQYSLPQIIKKFIEIRLEKKTYLIADKLQKRKSFFRKFSHDYIKQTEMYSDYTKIGHDFDVLVVGSDQVWNPNMMRRPLILDIPTTSKKISYASSIGRSDLSEYERSYIFPLLEDFDNIGVREQSLEEILDEAGIKSTTVLDPTLLISKDAWSNIANCRMIENPYVLIYSFSKCEFKTDISEYWKLKGRQVVYIPYAKQSYNKYDCIDDVATPLFDVGPKEFLSLIKYADHIYTDSFHGSVFSILFERQFSVFERSGKNNKVSMNSRIYDLLNDFGLYERMLKNDIKKELKVIDYTIVTPILERKREKSLKWLYAALTNE